MEAVVAPLDPKDLLDDTTLENQSDEGAEDQNDSPYRSDNEDDNGDYDDQASDSEDRSNPDVEFDDTIITGTLPLPSNVDTRTHNIKSPVLSCNTRSKKLSTMKELAKLIESASVADVKKEESEIQVETQQLRIDEPYQEDEVLGSNSIKQLLRHFKYSIVATDKSMSEIKMRLSLEEVKRGMDMLLFYVKYGRGSVSGQHSEPFSVFVEYLVDIKYVLVRKGHVSDATRGVTMNSEDRKKALQILFGLWETDWSTEGITVPKFELFINLVHWVNEIKQKDGALDSSAFRQHRMYLHYRDINIGESAYKYRDGKLVDHELTTELVAEGLGVLRKFVMNPSSIEAVDWEKKILLKKTVHTCLIRIRDALCKEGGIEDFLRTHSDQLHQHKSLEGELQKDKSNPSFVGSDTRKDNTLTLLEGFMSVTRDFDHPSKDRSYRVSTDTSKLRYPYDFRSDPRYNERNMFAIERELTAMLENTEGPLKYVGIYEPELPLISQLGLDEFWKLDINRVILSSQYILHLNHHHPPNILSSGSAKKRSMDKEFVVRNNGEKFFLPPLTDEPVIAASFKLSKSHSQVSEEVRKSVAKSKQEAKQKQKEAKKLQQQQKDTRKELEKLRKEKSKAEKDKNNANESIENSRKDISESKVQADSLGSADRRKQFHTDVDPIRQHSIYHESDDDDSSSSSTSPSGDELLVDGRAKETKDSPSAEEIKFIKALRSNDLNDPLWSSLYSSIVKKHKVSPNSSNVTSLRETLISDILHGKLKVFHGRLCRTKNSNYSVKDDSKNAVR